ncbi:coproporphyrinogen III oxidase [Haematococcus lacustris]
MPPSPASSPTPSHSQEFEEFVDYIQTTQQAILSAAEALDGSGRHFQRDQWQRNPADANAGWGATCVLEGGRLLEKAAANTTVVRGTLSAARAQAMSSRGRTEVDPQGGQAYAAAALSLVFHCANPLVPTLRADVRCFQVAGQSWFGGGCDLTPFYLFDEDAVAFHNYWKGMCDKHQPGLYPRLKQWCDSYFHIPARGEHRGIGGIFYDDLSSSDGGFDAAAFTRDVGRGILPSWQHIAETRGGHPFTQAEREWQLLRRGRYLEFNLLYDRGVRFGLDGGRMESIMVSAPPLIAWKYNVVPEHGSREAHLVDVLQKPRDWATAGS